MLLNDFIKISALSVFKNTSKNKTKWYFATIFIDVEKIRMRGNKSWHEWRKEKNKNRKITKNRYEKKRKKECYFFDSLSVYFYRITQYYSQSDITYIIARISYHLAEQN
jgi:hypothetical protein